MQPAGPGEPRLRLGDAWAGECTAGCRRAARGSQREVCNCGYARGRCEHGARNLPGAMKLSAVPFDGQWPAGLYFEGPRAAGDTEVIGGRTDPRRWRNLARAFSESYREAIARDSQQRAAATSEIGASQRRKPSNGPADLALLLDRGRSCIGGGRVAVVATFFLELRRFAVATRSALLKVRHHDGEDEFLFHRGRRT